MRTFRLSRLIVATALLLAPMAEAQISHTFTTGSGGYSSSTTHTPYMSWTTGTTRAGRSFSSNTIHSPYGISQSWGKTPSGRSWSSWSTDIGNSTWRTYDGPEGSRSSWTTHYGSGYGGSYSSTHTIPMKTPSDRSLTHWERTSGYSNGQPITTANWWASRQKYRRTFATGAERAKVKQRLLNRQTYSTVD